MTQKERKLARKKADHLFSQIVKSVGRCRKCGSTSRLQCAHIFTRGYDQIRWNLGNAFCLCQGCHMYFTNRPIEWKKYVVENIGQEKYDQLEAMAIDYGNPLNLEELVEKLEKVYNSV